MESGPNTIATVEAIQPAESVKVMVYGPAIKLAAVGVVCINRSSHW